GVLRAGAGRPERAVGRVEVAAVLPERLPMYLLHEAAAEAAAAAYVPPVGRRARVEGPLVAGGLVPDPPLEPVRRRGGGNGPRRRRGGARVGERVDPRTVGVRREERRGPRLAGRPCPWPSARDGPSPG
ncbi:hypothetical protein THAOC_11013, partial [Thalassiosira oceanica]